MNKIIGTLLLIAPLFSGCSNEQDSKVLRIAVTPASPPNLYEENGKTTGMDLELFEGFESEQDSNLKFNYSYPICYYEFM